MHIEIADDIIDALVDIGNDRSDEMRRAAVRVIRDAQRALAQCTQLITISPEAIDRLRESDLLFLPWEFEVFEIAAKRYFEIDDLLKRLKTHVLLTFCKDNGSRAIREGCEYLIINPLTDLSFSCAHRTAVVGENLNDCALFDCIVRWYFSLNDFSSRMAGSAARAVLGGGSTMAQVIRQELSDKSHAVVAIADSDKKYPNDKPGKTAQDVKKVRSALYRHHVISEVSEAENLLPQILIRNKWHRRNNGKSESHYYQLKNKDFSFDFLDLKKGITFDMFTDEKLKDYWEEQWKTDINELRGAVKDELKDDTRKILLGAMTESEQGSFLRKIIKDLKDMVCSGWDRIHLTKAQEQEWREIGALMLDMTCCYEADGSV